VYKTAAAIALAIIAASALTTTAEAGGGHGFYTSYFYRMQGRKPAVDPMAERRKREAEAYAERLRIRRLEAQRAEALRQAAAARRARLLEQQRLAAAKAEAASSASKEATAASTSTATPVVAQSGSPEAAKKADLLQTAATPATDAQKGACRKYSAAANGLVDGPCE